MSSQQTKWIEEGRTALGIEAGSTRIKAVLIGPDHKVLAAGSSRWENRYENGIWTYDLAQVWEGIKECYASLKREVSEQYGVRLVRVGRIGISAMMHGYLAFDRQGKQLAPFKTWRNGVPSRISRELTERLGFHIPERWSCAHLYLAALNGEEHVKEIAYMTTLSGYIHWKLTGRRCLGACDASGMFPVEGKERCWRREMAERFQELLKPFGVSWTLEDIFPEILLAGDEAGRLTWEGARLLDPEGDLQGGIPCCPPEGDGGTGMTATNSASARKGNISVGTSIFATLALEKEIRGCYSQIDQLATPAGRPAAMIHCYNGTSELNRWMKLFGEISETLGVPVSEDALYEALFRKAMEGESEGGGLIPCGYHSGEHLTGFEEGRPLLASWPDSSFSLANFMRAQINSLFATLRMGMDFLKEKEGITVDEIQGHGGFFRTKGVGQRLMAAALHTPVTVLETAGEGGAWGAALLAAYGAWKEEGEELEEYLEQKVFAGGGLLCREEPDPEEAAGYEKFMEYYRQLLKVERAAVEELGGWHAGD